MGGRESSQAEQGERDRYPGALRQLANFLHRAGENDSMCGKNDRSLCFLEQVSALA